MHLLQTHLRVVVARFRSRDLAEGRRHYPLPPLPDSAAGDRLCATPQFVQESRMIGGNTKEDDRTGSTWRFRSAKLGKRRGGAIVP